MHHRPSGPPLAARARGALTRWSVHLRTALRRAVPAGLGRLALGALVTTVVVGLVLAVPVISGIGSDTPSMALDATSSSSAGDRTGNSPVVMGLDGAPLPPSSAGESGTDPQASTASTAGADPTATTPPDVATAPRTTGSAPEATRGSTTAAPAPRRGSSSGTPSSTGTPSTAGTTSRGTTAPGTTPADTTIPGTTIPGTTAPGAGDPAAVPAEPAGEPQPESPASEALALINVERVAAGCGALSADPGSATTAAAHSATMGATGELGLDGLDLAALGGTAVVAEGAPTARSAVDAWLADPADAAVLLDCSRTTAGIGTAEGWWTALLV